ncbi:hypothetical protein VPH184E373B_0010 [Vibrio phage 184E37-3b]|nr:hypothetical protein MYOV056v2_p0011 [Vibrio phage 184E37.3a]QZI90043.1 hypothetical protein MYOV057v1_p0128 [Vibrio phage 184E37.1]
MNKQVTLKPDDILSHLILEDSVTAQAIAETPEWKDGDGILGMDIKVNGITVDTEVFRKVLMHMWIQANDRAKDAVDEDKFQERVQAAAKKLVQDSADGLMETMNELQNKLNDVDQLVKWSWANFYDWYNMHHKEAEL